MRPVHVGCSGWQYRDWRDTFYPPKLPQRRWLEHYATEFETVEVNSTFYRLAKPEAVARWVAETPADCILTVKASRYMTRIKRLTDLPESLERYYFFRPAGTPSSSGTSPGSPRTSATSCVRTAPRSSPTELREWADRLRDVREKAEVFAYFNNGWEAFAPRNARRLRALLGC